MESAIQRGEVAIGYKIESESKEKNQKFGIHLNPLKSDKFILSKEDKIFTNDFKLNADLFRLRRRFTLIHLRLSAS